MGKGESKLPPIPDHDLKTLLSYGLREEHMSALYRRFVEVDTDCNGVWTVMELYKLISEPRQSMRAPIIDAVFFMGDALGQGAINFQDFVVTCTSFCALSKEEMLQLLFIVVDKDRNGRIEKDELLEFFSYVPVGCGITEPIFPVNNKNALDKFRGGRWESLAFDGLAQLVERFPYIVYPAYHAQELYRAALLGRSFWDRLDSERSRFHRMRREIAVTLPGSKQKVRVQMPGRCTMQELLEYSRRKTAVYNGKRVVRTEKPGDSVSMVTKERDDEIARCPLLRMIRNPHCMYYVPFSPSREEAVQYKSARAAPATPDFAEFALETEQSLAETSRGVRVLRTGPGATTSSRGRTSSDLEGSSSSGSYESGDESEEDDD